MCSALGQTGSFYHNEGGHVHTYDRRMKAQGHLKDFFLSQNTSLLEYSHLALMSALDKVFNIVGFGPLHNLHLDISKL